MGKNIVEVFILFLQMIPTFFCQVMLPKSFIGI